MKQIVMWTGISILMINMSACINIQGATSTAASAPTASIDARTPMFDVIKIQTQAKSTETVTYTATIMPSMTKVTTGHTQTSAFTGSRISLQSLLFEGHAGCDLPCWHDALPGQSTEDEVTVVMQTIAGIDLSAMQSYGFSITHLTKPELKMEYYTKEDYVWHVSNFEGGPQPAGSLLLSTSFRETNHTLEMIHLSWIMANSSRAQVDMSPLVVIRKLGAPSYLFVHPEIYGSSDLGGVRLLLLYPQGVLFQFLYGDMTFKTTPTRNPAIQDTHVEICLATLETNPRTNIGHILGDVFLIRPFSADLSDLSPVQDSVITDIIEAYKYKPVEQVFGVSTQAIAAQAAAGKDVCLSTIIR